MNSKKIHFRRFAFALLILTVVYTNKVVAQSKAMQIDELVRSYTNLGLFNGSIMVAQKGKVIMEKSYGLSNREWNIPNTVNTEFRIGSLTKQFTVMLIMQLKQAGKLDLNAHISDYLPYYRKDIGNRVTIHHLLTHTSGIPDYTNRPDFFTNIAMHDYSPKDFVLKFCSDSLVSEPGTKYNYCNSEYYILGAIVEAISNKPYAEVLRGQIFNVIGMNHSGVDIPGVIIPNRAGGYNCVYGVYTNADYINMGSSIYAAGGIYSTVGDLLLWDRALYGEKLLSKENKKMMFTPFLNKYGYGIGINKTAVPGLKNEVTFTSHTGAINGFRSVMLHEIEDDDVVIVLGNTVINNNFDIDLNPISNRIFSILHNLPYENPKPSIAAIVGEKTYRGSVENALAFFYHLTLKEREKYDFSTEESEFNSLGYFLLGKQRVSDAIAIFKLNTDEFPKSWNAFDSYAESLVDGGQVSAAIINYKRSLELNPQNTNATEQLKALEKKK